MSAELLLMLGDIIETAGLSIEVCANSLGLDKSTFESWVSGKSPIPFYILPELSCVLGVAEEDLTSQARTIQPPPIWFKVKDEMKLRDEDKELVLTIRRFGAQMKSLSEIVGANSARWQTIFASVRDKVDPQKTHTDQGLSAARYFREFSGLGFPKMVMATIHGGNGDLIRGILRSMGILVIESPTPKSLVKGFSFRTGTLQEPTPTLYVNTYGQKWFERNYVLLHELAHAIFDQKADDLTIDYAGPESSEEIELRADAFARGVLVGKDMLIHLASSQKVQWQSLTPRSLALAVALTQAPKRVVVAAASENGFVPEDKAEAALAWELDAELRTLTERVLPLQEYRKRSGNEPVFDVAPRLTTLTSKPLRLPVSYIKAVLNVLQDGEISEGKAAEMLLIDKWEFRERFAEQLSLAHA